MKLDKKKIPRECGVYFFRNKRGQILYIGKAVSLKNRLASYLKSQLSGRTAKLVEKAARVSWQETDSEIEALILESQFIKKYKPPFNIMLRDDKQYFYVGFSNDEFPKIFITHQPLTQSPITNYQSLTKKREFSSLEIINYKLEIAYAGPFTDGSALKTTLRLLRRIFPYCTCKQKHNNFCLNYHIGKCGGLCCLKPKQQSPNFQFSIFNFQKEYSKNIKAIKDILSGKRTTLIKKLKKEMADLGKTGKFEEAIELRDKIEKLKKVFENARILQNTKYKILNTKSTQKQTEPLYALRSILKLPHFPRRIEGYDISNIQGQFAAGAMVVFTDGRPDKSQYRKFRIKGLSQIYRHRKSKEQRLAMSLNQKPNDIAMLKEVLTRRLNHSEWLWPDLIVMDGGKAQLNIASKIISGLRKTKGLAKIQNRDIPIIALTKDKQHRGSHIYLWSSSRFYSSQSDDYKIESRFVCASAGDKSRILDFCKQKSGDPRFPLESGQDPRLGDGVIPLKKLPERVRNLILQVDAEAHRFAIGYYRKLHRKLD